MTGEGAMLVRLLVCFLALCLMWGWSARAHEREEVLGKEEGRTGDARRWPL